MSIKQNLWKILVMPLAGVTFYTSLFGFVDKVEAQVNLNQAVSSFLTSGSGRWLEIEPGSFWDSSCYIYDLKPFNGQLLRVIREQYGKNLFNIPGEECRFSLGPLGGSLQSIGVVENNGNTLTIRYLIGFTEQIQLLQFDTQQQLILVQKINTRNVWRRFPR